MSDTELAARVAALETEVRHLQDARLEDNALIKRVIDTCDTTYAAARDALAIMRTVIVLREPLK